MLESQSVLHGFNSVEEQIEEKKNNDAQLLLNLKVQVWKDKRTIQKLEPRTKELAKNLEYYKSLEEFVSLGAVGMETLLLKLKYDNIPILEMIKEVKKVSIVKVDYWNFANLCYRALILLRLQHRLLLRMLCRSFSDWITELHEKRMNLNTCILAMCGIKE